MSDGGGPFLFPKIWETSREWARIIGPVGTVVDIGQVGSGQVGSGQVGPGQVSPGQVSPALVGPRLGWLRPGWQN